jgi:uncharacterized integral membrane protein (TIGR00697 family)
LKEYKYYPYIMAFFVAILIISNIASTKILKVGFFSFDGGTILFPLSYIFGDILTEVYGYAKARRVIWMGFFCTALAALIFFIVQILPPAKGWENQDAYEKILGLTPRIVVASLIAYFAGEFSNSFTLAKMKILTKGRWLWTRTIGSTLVGEFVDTVLFVAVAFFGAFNYGLLIAVFISNYIFKVGVEIVATPVTYMVVRFLKNSEGIDYYDYKTKFNPFHIGTHE